MIPIFKMSRTLIHEAQVGFMHQRRALDGVICPLAPQTTVGDPAELIVNQEGYVAVNDVQLQLMLPGRAEDKILTVILCKADDREEMARRYYRLKGFEVIEERYRKRIQELEDGRSSVGPLADDELCDLRVGEPRGR